ncbi:hypothetical protein F6X40_28640 [Paraburkholderia sp. UCT31]|uniref:hypothetical protein n=1 Tax=Paraburkholderia sp. UCT31 TaxID=2615209 RepID=UPI00165503DC|nr:hypothetical protein [Paraburkholderia sp. UCT31]MBC8740603.1 hypothetical protein [Paraburkholderia sp. UCT31]
MLKTTAAAIRIFFIFAFTPFKWDASAASGNYAQLVALVTREPLSYHQLSLTGKQRQHQQSGSVDFGILRLMPPNRSPATTSGDITPKIDFIVNFDVVILFSADAESVLARKKAQLRRRGGR